MRLIKGTFIGDNDVPSYIGVFVPDGADHIRFVVSDATQPERPQVIVLTTDAGDALALAKAIIDAALIVDPGLNVEAMLKTPHGE